MLKLPLAGFAPLQSPLAVHDVGLLVVVQLSVVDAPGNIGPIGLAANVTIGKPGGGLVTTTWIVISGLVPLLFEHDNV